MHIIISATTTQDQLKHAGPGQFTKNVIEQMVVAHPETKFTLLLFDSASTLDDFIARCTKENKSNLEIVRIGPYRVSNYLNVIWYYLQYLPQIKKIKQPDSVYFSPYFWRYFPAKELPTVLFIHDFALPIFKFYSAKGPLHNYFRKFQYWDALNDSVDCRAIITNIAHTKEEYLNRYPKYPSDKVFEVELGIELPSTKNLTKQIALKYFPRDWKERGYFIYLGGEATITKNTAGLLWGYYRFLQSYKNKKKPPYLVIAGREFINIRRKDVKVLHDLIDKLNIRDNIVFTGFYDDEEKYSLLKNSIAFIHLSYYEGFGLALGEAMRTGVAVIANKNQAYEYVLGDSGMLVDGHNPWKVAEVMKEIHENKKLRKELGEKAYKRSLRFKWNATAEKIYQILIDARNEK